ncbi:MAG: VWA domain-containing protein, partial [Actinobacteria bacterium]
MRRASKFPFAAHFLTAYTVAALAFAGAAICSPRVVPPPVLVVDAGLGDAALWSSMWLGSSATTVASNGGFELARSTTPAWWRSNAATPTTYLLAPSGSAASPLTAEKVAWALDEIARQDSFHRSVVVAQGLAGVPVREYLQGLSGPPYARRADVVGLVMLGPANNGLSLAAEYPNAATWSASTEKIGASSSDLLPGASRVDRLRTAGWPSTVRALVVRGEATNLARHDTDGLVVRADSELPTDTGMISVDYARVAARASGAYSLQSAWLPVAHEKLPAGKRVALRDVQMFGPARGYATDPGTIDAVRTFYSTWFTKGAPTTHISTRLVIDTSGSMREPFGRQSKLEAAQAAAVDFIDSLTARRALPGSLPEDVAVIAFSEKPTAVSEAGGASAGVRRLKARGNTDVGRALEAAVNSALAAPGGADKH